MKYLYKAAFILLLLLTGLQYGQSQSNITRVEYYFDTDPGLGSATPLTIPAGQIVLNNLTIPVDPGALSQGVHRLYARAKNADGNWGLVNSWLFYKPYDGATAPPVGTISNINRVEYYFDTDPGLGLAASLSIPTGQTTLNDLVIPVDPATLSQGVHRLYARAQNAAGHWGLVNSWLFYKPYDGATAPPVGTISNINRVEYYFDNDPGLGSATSLGIPTGQTTLNDLVIPVDPATLTQGVHRLYARARNAAGHWSLVNSWLFYKPYDGATAPPIGVLSNIDRVEYFFDNDPGLGSATALTIPSGQTTLNDLVIPVDPTTVSQGVHRLYARARNAAGHWSLVNSWLFYKPYDGATAPPPATLANLQKIEYYIDTDPGLGNAIPLAFAPGTSASNLVTSINITGLATGAHKLHVRAKDANGVWSLVNTHDFNITTVQAAPAINISTVSKNYLCGGDALEVSFKATGTFTTGNQFRLYLSDATGSFAGETLIGSLATTNLGGIIAATVPPGIAAGTQYKMRIKSTATALTGQASQQAFATSCPFETDPVITLASKNNINCKDGSNGRIQVNVAGGNLPYTYAWTKTGSPGFTYNLEILENVSAGTYNLTVTTAGGRTATFTETITEPTTGVTGTITPIHPPCSSNNIGSATVNPTGGTAPYTYLWSNGGNTNTINQLAAGTYSVLITDASGCKFNASITLTNQGNGPSATISTTNPACSGVNNGSATANPTGGTAPYTYLWSNGATFKTISNLSDGSYSVVVTDANGCSTGANAVLTNGINSATATITANGSTTLCTGQNVQLTANAGSSWLWSNGATTQSILVTNAGNYTVTVFNASGCSATSAATTVTVNPPPVWYTDNDEDGYGTGATVQACVRPAKGFTAAELTATTGDCNDNNANINPTKQYFAYTGNSGYTGKVIDAETGSSYTNFRFEVDYFDATGALPPTGFPRVLLDYEGNGGFTGANDRTLVMQPADAGDNNTADGKRYVATINSLPYGNSYKTRIVVGDPNNCGPEFGDFDYPNVLQEPNLSIFANDITFSKRRPEPGEAITVTALVRNESDYAAQNFEVKLINQFSPTTVYPNQTVSYVAPRGTTLVSWNITTPAVPSWNPMQVRVDVTNLIAENNELDNDAVRPFVNGNYPVPGNIVTTASASPGAICSYPYTQWITLSGSAIYTDLAIPLPDPSVAGATVDITITETGATYSGYTNSLGQYSIRFPAPVAVGTYHITGTTTDFTLEGQFTSQFSVVACNVCTLPDLSVSLSPYSTTIVQGNPVNISATVTNSGQTATTQNTVLALSQTGGTPFANSQVTVPPLASGQSFTVSLGAVNFELPGNYVLYANADANQLINECSESNSGNAYVNVLPNLPDIIPVGGPSGTAYNCPNPSTPFNLYNAGGIATGAFTAEVQVIFGGNVVGTYQHSVPGIGFHQSYSFTVPHTYTQYGQYSYTIKADIPTSIGGVVTELNEINNEATYTNSFTLLACKPNFTLSTCPNPLVSPLNPQSVGTLTFSVVLNNSGNAPATGTKRVRFAFSDGTIRTATHLGTLAAGGSVTLSVNAPTPASGTTLTIIADPANDFDEFSENDNSYTNTMCYDFKPVEACGYPKTFSGGMNLNQAATPWVAVAQKYLYRASVVKVKFEVSGPGIAGNQLLGYVNLNNPASACYCPSIVSLPSSYVFGQVGTYTFTYTVDPDNEYTECDETDNVMQTQVVVSNQPDMRILSQYLNPTKLNPNTGEAVTYAVTYENIGTSNVNAQMKLKLQLDGVDHQQVTVSGLASGDKYTVAFTLPWSSTINGAHVARAIIDPQNQVVESDELNNEATRAIVVGQAANLYFDFLTSTTTLNPVVGQTINLQGKIMNGGSQACNAYVQFYFRNNSGEWEQITDDFLGSQAFITIDGNGVTYVNFPWLVTNANTVIEARIVNATAIEFNYDDNNKQLSLGGFVVNLTGTSANCGTNGSLVANATGGTAPYFYSWSNGPTGATLTATPGTYEVTVTDANGNARTASGTIAQLPDAIAPVMANCPVNIISPTTVVSWTEPTFTDNCGAISISSTHSPGSTFSTGLTTVTFTATDGSGNTTNCSFTVTVLPATYVVTISGTQEVLCNSSKTGSLTATPTGGRAPYTYLWSNGKKTATISLLGAGTYTVTVTDSHGETTTATHTITQPGKVNATLLATAASCFGNTDGKLEVAVTGGTPGYTYSLDGINYQPSNLFENLVAGSYSVRVKDANNCTVSAPGTVREPALLTAGILTVTPTCFGAGTGSISVTIAGGNNPKTYAWTGPNGFVSNSKNIKKLLPGIYTLLVTDSKGCTASTSAEVTSYTQYLSNPVVTNTTCRAGNDGAINLTPSGGSGTGFSASWTGPNNFISPNEDIAGLVPGTYRLSLTDIGTGCVLKEIHIVGQPLTGPSVAATLTQVTTCGGTGSINATASNGQAPFQFSLNGGTPQPGGLFTGLAPGSYLITAIDATGCTGSRTFTLKDNGSDLYESNNSRTTAKTINTGQNVLARIGTATDQDWFKFTTAAFGGTYSISISHPSVSYTTVLQTTAGVVVTPDSELPGVKNYTLAPNTAYVVQVTGEQSSVCYMMLVENDIPVQILTAKPVEVAIPDNLVAKAYPNPHEGHFIIEVESTVSGEATIVLYDLQGRAITERKQNLKAGKNQVSFPNMKHMTFVYRVIQGSLGTSGKILGLK